MYKRITFSPNKKSTIELIDSFSHAKRCSRSEVISFLLNATVPVLNKIISQYHMAETLEYTLSCLFKEKEVITKRTDPKLTYEEFFFSIWKTQIRFSNEIIDNDFHKHKISHNRMGRGEKNKIHEKLSMLIDKFNAKKAIFIYTDRRVNNDYLIAGGISNIILIKKVVYDGHVFDFNRIVILPIFELITFGVEEVFKRKNISPVQSCLCWIPIYHTNELAVMVPVLAEGDATQKSITGRKTIIVNPFVEEINNNF